MESHIDVATLSKISLGVDDINHNGIFDEGDVLKGDARSVASNSWDGGDVKNACGPHFTREDFVLTPNDTKSVKDLEAFLWRALHRDVHFFNVKSKDGYDKLYVAIPQQDCYDDIDNPKLEYVIRTKTDAGHIGDSYGFGERDEIIYIFEPGMDMMTWLQSAESYLYDK